MEELKPVVSEKKELENENTSTLTSSLAFFDNLGF